MTAEHDTDRAEANIDRDFAAEESVRANRSTERVRLHRERRRRGLTPIAVEVYTEEIEDLVQHGLLPADQRHDRGAVAEAVGQILDRAFRLLRGGWLPKG